MPVSRERKPQRTDRDTSRGDRPRRIPVSGNRDVLTVGNKEDGFVYRWVLDTGNRIDKFKQGGYEVAPDTGLLVGDARVATTNEHGASVIARGRDGNPLVLMRIQKDWYKEDQDYKEEEVRKMEQTIEGGNRADGRYGSVYVGDKPQY